MRLFTGLRTFSRCMYKLGHMQLSNIFVKKDSNIKYKHEPAPQVLEWWPLKLSVFRKKIWYSKVTFINAKIKPQDIVCAIYNYEIKKQSFKNKKPVRPCLRHSLL